MVRDHDLSSLYSLPAVKGIFTFRVKTKCRSISHFSCAVITI